MTSDGSGKPLVALALRDGDLHRRLEDLLEDAGVEVEKVGRGAEWVKDVARSDASVVVLRAGGDGLIEAIQELAGRRSAPEVLIVAGDEEPVDHVEMLAAGAAGVFPADAPDAALRRALETVTGALADRGPMRPEGPGPAAQPRLADFVSRSPRMRAFLQMVERVKTSDSSLLIVGETGVGKEHLARAVHAESARAEHPFVGVNCGAIPEHLLESELFGHEKGAFTGAAGRRTGRFRQADKGTIFLDEIGELPKQLQVSLLTVLQRFEVRPLGAEKPLPVDVRVMAATNRDLAQDIGDGRFREDLYYRLNVISLEIPPLRDRREDIPHLVGSFMRHFAPGLEREGVRSISPAAMEALLRHDWPGNIRELINVVERAMLLCQGTAISLADLPEPLGSQPREGLAADVLRLPPQWDDRPFREVKREVTDRFERRYLERLLEKTGGRVGECARLAGIAERTLYEKMKRLDLRKEDYRD